MAGLHRHAHGQLGADSLDTGLPGCAYPEFLNYDVVEQPPEILWVCSGAFGRLQGIRRRLPADVWCARFTACSLLRPVLRRRSVHPSSLTVRKLQDPRCLQSRRRMFHIIDRAYFSTLHLLLINLWGPVTGPTLFFRFLLFDLPVNSLLFKP